MTHPFLPRVAGFVVLTWVAVAGTPPRLQAALPAAVASVHGQRHREAADRQGTPAPRADANGRAPVVSPSNRVSRPGPSPAIVPPPPTLDGQPYGTPQLTPLAARDPGTAAGDEDGPFFGELIVPKDSAFVGEQVPIELRFYFDRRLSFQPYPQGQLPIIDGDGFVTRRYPEPVERRQYVNGKEYGVLIYKTAISGVKAGKLELHSAYQEFLLRMPLNRRRPNGFDDFFDQPPFADLFGGGPRKEVKVETNGVSLDIRPLPTAGRPPDFSGAVGQFSLSSSVGSDQAGVGEPVSLRIEVRGLGNFDRMEDPHLTETAGWHAYGPSAELTPLDEVGVSAVKAYTFPLAAETVVGRTPGASLWYFDPVTEAYVEAKAPPVPLVIAGAPPAVPGPAPDGSAAAHDEPANRDAVILQDIRTGLGSGQGAFVSVVDRPVFWLAQLLPAGVLAGWAGFGAWRKLHARRAPVWKARRERAKCLRQLDAPDAKTALDAAVRLIELTPVLRSKGEVRVRNAADLVDRQTMPDALRADLRRIFRARDAARFAQGGTPLPWSDADRQELKETVQRWEALA